ncbi:major facilitator superfamily domain-containing protein 12-like [Macrobrachium nipponense]|uniref:major facilitator superfamily domain-containing protein 12-like n=1 Tax=Macrobrachium nipponense TaxID=159736 RepID=UPI0030C88989
MALEKRVKYGYSVGHIFNDLCASMWFTYLLVYLQYVLQLDRGLSGFLLFLGQVADAVSTPLIAMQSDRGCTFGSYGRKKSWHVIGTICVILSFPFIFIVCWVCFGSLGQGYVLMIGVMICLFQFGWAAVQVSHLALIPDLTDLEAERDELNILRYVFDVCSDMLVYLVAWMAFSKSRTVEEKTAIGPEDAGKFQTITISVMIVGSIFSVIFHVFTPERGGRWTAEQEREVLSTETVDEVRASTAAGAEGEDATTRPMGQLGLPDFRMHWRDWMNEPQFYKVMLLYANARLVANLANIYMPIFLQESVHARESMIALIPLCMSLSGVGASFLLKGMRKFIGKKACVVVGIVIGLVAATVSALPWMPEWALYCLSVLWGVSGSLLIVLSLAFTSDIIGVRTESSSFVYGSLCFGDKIVNGLAVFLIQELTRTACMGPDCSNYYRHVMSLGIFIPLMLCFIAMCLISRERLGHTRKLAKAYKEREESSGSSGSSESSEILLSTNTNLGYGTVTKV